MDDCEMFESLLSHIETELNSNTLEPSSKEGLSLDQKLEKIEVRDFLECNEFVNDFTQIRSNEWRSKNRCIFFTHLFHNGNASAFPFTTFFVTTAAYVLIFY